MFAIKMELRYLDVALNHAFGETRWLWMNDPDGDGWGSLKALFQY
jgi:hypothetical protein